VPARRRRAWRPLRLAQYTALLGLLAASDLPLVWILATAFKPDTEIVRYPPTFLPHAPTLANFTNLFTISDFGTYLSNSLIVSGVTTAATVVFGMLAAYSVSRFRFSFVRGLGEFALFAYLVPPILVVVPITQVVIRLHLADNLAALVVIYSAILLPFALWLLRSYFHGLSVEIEQAAMVDGCTRFGAFRRVVVPQAIPGLISTGIFTFNAAWSEYLFASVLLPSPDRRTLSPGLALLMNQTGVYSWGLLMAGAVIVVLPVLVLFVVAQRSLISGWGAGALAG
jgi:multiple sugar transport system permease protein